MYIYIYICVCVYIYNYTCKKSFGVRVQLRTVSESQFFVGKIAAVTSPFSPFSLEAFTVAALGNDPPMAMQPQHGQEVGVQKRWIPDPWEETSVFP